MDSYRAEIELFFVEEGSATGDLPREGKNTEMFTANEKEEALVEFADIIRKYVGKNGQRKGRCLKARLYLGAILVHEVDQCVSKIQQPLVCANAAGGGFGGEKY